MRAIGATLWYSCVMSVTGLIPRTCKGALRPYMILGVLEAGGMDEAVCLVQVLESELIHWRSTCLSCMSGTPFACIGLTVVVYQELGVQNAPC